ncbi:sugar ABC transporter ATP-binding protein [Streptosporangium sp. NBC_01469]|uniref:sugar ABC transporter ATP-binding protein n=1 Tax=Streptosporangium sp. NBC_01469 TaxID=2903898 RepID=UPI002E2DE2A5|nr:sugar ABC transporter ATP-binding protein [Streptosporangium sp. NBC_01469]
MRTPAVNVLSARDVTKVYGDTPTLRGVDFDVAAGRVTALFGENGAGKSTLMRILSGIERPTAGHVELDGEPVRFVSPRDAADRGVSIVHQGLSLCPNLSIQDNLFLAREICGGPWVIDRSSQRATTAAILHSLEEYLDPGLLVGDLTPGEQQIVEIARALLQEARVLIMDEPTSALTAPEIEVLFRVIRELTANGVAIVYVSAHLEEALEIADDVAVLRDGRLIATADAENVDVRWIVERTTDRDQGDLFPHHTPATGAEVLALRGLVVADPANPGRLAIDDLSLTVREGEIVGIYGMTGSGRTELLEALAGRIPSQSGEILLSGVPLERAGIRDRIGLGMVLVPGDRRRDGLVQTMSVGENLSLAGLGRFVRRLLVSRDRERDAVNQMITGIAVGRDGTEAPIASLSGGDQQKVVIGRALLTTPRVLLLDEPSRGVDTDARADIFELMAARAERGMAVVFTTSDAEEALRVPDRLLVLACGALAGEFRRGEITREKLMRVSDGTTVNTDEDEEGAG